MQYKFHRLDSPKEPKKSAANIAEKSLALRSISSVLLALAIIFGCLVFSPPLYCDEGMWLPQELPDFIMQGMRQAGCKLDREEIYNSLGTGVANAVVRVGATGSFVSPEGLILTNHHVAFGAVQRMSTPEENYMTQGFIARSREEEVPALGYIVYVTQSVEDVTQKVLSALKPSMSPLERYKAIERRTLEIIKKAEEGKDAYCEMRAFFGGSRYLLYTSAKIKDVRVVYVPAGSIGNYGGDIDNWMWPRHTCDFSFLRAYVAPDGKTAEYSKTNVPYRPKSYLKIAPQGLRDGEFAFIVGFPAWTDRYLTSCALKDIEEFEYPQRIRLQSQMVQILEDESRADPVAAVKVANQLKGLNNYLKKYQGVMGGFERFSLVQRQEEREANLAADANTDKELYDKTAGVLAKYKSLYAENAQFEMKDLVLEYLLERESLLGEAELIYKWSIEKTKKDLDRDPRFAERRIPDLKRELRVFQTGLFLQSDREMLKMLLKEASALPPDQRVVAVDEALGAASGTELEQNIDTFLDNLYGHTKLGTTEERLRMFDLSHERLLKEGDAFIAFAAKLYDENEKRIDRRESFASSLDMLFPQWIEIISKGSKSNLYADGNGTMRISYGSVEGYAPRDAVYYLPFTSLNGVVEKNTGVDPFDCPKRILELAASKTYGSYASPDLSDVAVNVLTTTDSTNGNSGSPLLNSKGELVGCLFDGNYEALSSDFEFEDDLTRSISVDIRYVLFVADLVDNAQNVLEELGVK